MTNSIRLFTVIATKLERSPVVLQEDADNIGTATRNAIARLPADFVDVHDLRLVGEFLSGADKIKLRKDNRLHSLWWWPQSEDISVSFKLCVVETKLEVCA